jgi:hypothetical protein
VTATDESTQALDRLGELRILAREAFLVNKEITSSERRAFADYEEAQAAAMNAAQAVRDAVQGLWQSAHGSAARGAS